MPHHVQRYSMSCEHPDDDVFKSQRLVYLQSPSFKRKARNATVRMTSSHGNITETFPFRIWNPAIEPQPERQIISQAIKPISKTTINGRTPFQNKGRSDADQDRRFRGRDHLKVRQPCQTTTGIFNKTEQRLDNNGQVEKRGVPEHKTWPTGFFRQHDGDVFVPPDWRHAASTAASSMYFSDTRSVRLRTYRP